MQLSLVVKSCITVCACVNVLSRPAVFQSPSNVITDAAFAWILSCSDDPLGNACYRDCSCSRLGGKLLCPEVLPAVVKN
ncbi:hypothetical protein BC939DRAFT_454504 [Gamsiella multidivaricata]|uniref:uncharacterized protein n=1 Tax=Gamsiella multidivaricata TaxID=101098 RepID=UPI00221E4FE0|nr:uncharacterized protein BC939DRAFT_454504 [Gamsiella multidivaricata]KAI7822019.1 hypothetical protein BC939DRAFT_454504 [Gamsiella multidivaricata]